MIKIHSKSAFYLALMGVLLAGCTDRVSLAESKMQEIQSQPAQEVEPPPQPQKIEDYVYAATNVRSPFVAQSMLDMQQRIDAMPTIKPDEKRVKQPLEAFELSELVYRGRVIAPNGQQYGLVQTPDGMVHDIQVGNYMGKNHGRIVEITATQVNLIEIVEDTQAGYVEKTNSLESP